MCNCPNSRVGMIYGIYVCVPVICDSVIVTVIRKHAVEWWAAGEDLSLEEVSYLVNVLRNSTVFVQWLLVLSSAVVSRKAEASLLFSTRHSFNVQERRSQAKKREKACRPSSRLFCRDVVRGRRMECRWEQRQGLLTRLPHCRWVSDPGCQTQCRSWWCWQEWWIRLQNQPTSYCGTSL